MSFRKFFSRIDWSFALICLLSGGSALAVLHREGWPKFFDIFTEDFSLFLEIVPKSIAGTLIGALVRLLVPREVIRQWIGENSGFFGLFIAAFAGILFPAGPFTVFPLAAAFLVAGADRGAAVAFITGWLLLGLNRAVIWEMPFFGFHFVALRSVGAVFMPVLAGWIARSIPLRFVMRGA
ncbi:permease [Terrarubrum flagellatum]|uniref:permease n=1 Tax=Terrirubrum flagellatum TaxID=2895980 RepID=UPI0031451D37